MKRGVFIVVEGVDGAGKGAQIELLRAALVARGRAVHVTAEPSTWPIGALLRRYLRRELPDSVPGPSGMALLFAADRMQHLACEVTPRLDEGEVVLCDRYVASSIAYQSAMSAAGEDERDRLMPWIAQINDHARSPDLTIVLDLDPEIAAQRRAARGTPGELFEHLELQRRVRRNYGKVALVRPRDRIVTLDASPSPAEIHQRVMDLVVSLRDV